MGEVRRTCRELGPKRDTGFDAGLAWGERRRASLQVTAFRSCCSCSRRMAFSICSLPMEPPAGVGGADTPMGITDGPLEAEAGAMCRWLPGCSLAGRRCRCLDVACPASRDSGRSTCFDDVRPAFRTATDDSGSVTAARMEVDRTLLGLALIGSGILSMLLQLGAGDRRRAGAASAPSCEAQKPSSGRARCGESARYCSSIVSSPLRRTCGCSSRGLLMTHSCGSADMEKLW
mmetsp:Transcript_124712/g.349290  ORF Transcript_124712/g.349290 Transcript_124712/m.349290 type:complete len:232 (+) Transcript_124712:471-1166(+)